MTKLIISKDGVKRELETPFAICISQKDLDELVGELKRLSLGDWVYGWLLVDTSHPDKSPPNTHPRPWSD